MGRLDAFTDMTGSMSQQEINGQNIEQIIDELNRAADQVDALSNSISIVNRNNVTVPLSGNTYNASVNIQTSVASSFLAYMSRSDQPGNYFVLPYFATSGVPVSALQMAVSASLQSAAGNQVMLNIQGVVGAGYAAPSSITVYYYILSQPANASGK